MQTREQFLREYHTQVLDKLVLPPGLREQYCLQACLKDGERQVYLVRDQADLPAILKLQPAGREDTLKQEYELLRGLRHPQLPQPMAYLEWEGMEYLVREYVDGVSLHEQVTAQGPLSPDKVRQAALSLCQVLQYLHSQTPPVICRDVKPQNVILDSEGCCHLIDLGAARRHRPEQQGDTVFLGTQVTAPPEQFGYQQTDQRSDLYSLGVLMRFLRTGSFEPSKQDNIRTKLLPYFGRLKMCNITAQQIITWQNEMLNHKDENGKPYSPVYLKTVHNQLSAIFNHAVRYYNLRENPCKKAGSMGKKKNREMMFWTKEQYLKFAEVMMDKPLSFYAFEMLYWCGIREGELLALTPADFDFEKRTVTINKSYQRLNGQDLITTPKTEKSNRVITMPQFLAEEIQDYIKMLYGIGPDDRMFTITKSYLHREMDRGAKEAGVPRIRIHDIRHSAVSLLIDMGFSATAIADRVGHESIDITYNYAHLFPSKQAEMADKLNMERGN